MNIGLYQTKMRKYLSRVPKLWNNGKEVPQQLGDVIVVTNSLPIGHMRSQLNNYQVEIILDVQAWSEKLY